jgi:hypothetical protein
VHDGGAGTHTAVLRVSAELCIGKRHHRVANDKAVHARANRHDIAGELAAQYGLAWCSKAKGQASREAKAVGHAEAAYAPVGRGHRGGAHANEHLVRARNGPRDVLDGDNLRWSVTSDHRGLHVC